MRRIKWGIRGNCSRRRRGGRSRVWGHPCKSELEVEVKTVWYTHQFLNKFSQHIQPTFISNTQKTKTHIWWFFKLGHKTWTIYQLTVRNRRDVTKIPSLNSRKVKPGPVEGKFLENPKLRLNHRNRRRRLWLTKLKNTDEVLKNVANSSDQLFDTMLTNEINEKFEDWI